MATGPAGSPTGGNSTLQTEPLVAGHCWHGGCWSASTMTGRDDAGRGPGPATQPLREDYAALQPVLRGMTALAGRVRSGAPVHPLLLVGALTCLDAFQRSLDLKIEAALFPALLPRHDALSVDARNEITREHGEVRQRVAAVRRLLAGSGRLSEAVCRLAEDCVAFLQAHAVHEMEDLFGLADRVLSLEDASPLWDAFRQIDAREIRPGERQALSALAAAIDPGRKHLVDAVPHIEGVVAAHVMRPRPRSVRPADTLARAAEIMERAGVRELPVVQDGRLCGILARSDLQAHSGHLEWTGVEAAMTAEPVVVTPEQPAAAVSQVLLRGRFNAVPVIADDTTLVGMVSRSDLLRAVADPASGAGH